MARRPRTGRCWSGCQTKCTSLLRTPRTIPTIPACQAVNSNSSNVQPSGTQSITCVLRTWSLHTVACHQSQQRIFNIRKNLARFPGSRRQQNIARLLKDGNGIGRIALTATAELRRFFCLFAGTLSTPGGINNNCCYLWATKAKPRAAAVFVCLWHARRSPVFLLFCLQTIPQYFGAFKRISRRHK